MANLKNITNLPMAKSSEGLNLIVNDNGAAKQIPANAIGKVKTVNSVEPDENGNVNIEISEGFSGSWNDLEDKPFYEKEAEPIFEGDVENFTYLDKPIPIEKASSYRYLLDGVEYICESFWDDTGDGDSLAMLDENDQPAWYIMGCQYINFPGALPGDIRHLKIIDPTANEIKKIDPKFIPDSVGLVQRIDVFIDGDTFTCDKTYDELQELVLKGVLLYAVIRRSDSTIYLDGGFYVYSHYYYPDDDQLLFYSTDGRSLLRFSSLDDGKKITREVVN